MLDRLKTFLSDLAGGAKRPDHGVGLGKEQLGEKKTGRGRIEEEVVPLDRRSDRAGDNRPIELSPVVNRRSRLHYESPLLD